MADIQTSLRRNNVIDARNVFMNKFIGFGAQLIGPIQLHVKRQSSNICKFFQDIAWTFFCLWVARSAIHLSKKVKRQPTLIISFS